MLSLAVILALGATANAHTAGWNPGMYCFGGNVTGVDDPNTNTAVNPPGDLPFDQWLFQADRGCDLMPPAPGVYLELPAGETVQLQLTHNRAQTTYSYNGAY